jgi:superfamily II DNA helicase RecQ
MHLNKSIMHNKARNWLYFKTESLVSARPFFVAWNGQLHTLTLVKCSMALSDALQRLKVDNFRGKQDEAVNSILTGRDVVYVFPTGAGKSLVYQIAALCSPHVTVIISPLIVLLHQRVQRLTEAGISVVEAYGESFYLYGSMSDVKLVYTSPE